MWWLLIPPGASLVTHAARLLPTIPFAIDLPLVLHPSFGPPGCIGTPAAIAVSRGPTQVMHGPPYIFDPLLQASPFPPAERRYRALSIPFLSFSFLVVSRRAMRCSLFCSPCVARSPLALPLLALLFSSSPLVAPCVRRCVVCTVHVEHPRPARRAATPVIVRLVTGMRSTDTQLNRTTASQLAADARC